MSRPRRLLRAIALALGVACSAVLLACSVLFTYPDSKTPEQREREIPAEGLPLANDVTVHWGAHSIPFLEASNDADLAFSLGLLHAHLRLGQMELMRRASAGRLSEMAGPLAQEIDVALRTLDLGKSTAETERRLPIATRAWLQQYVRGVNWFLKHAEQLPPEFRLLGFEVEGWTVRDVLRIGRLASGDLSWIYYVQALRLEKIAGGKALRRELLQITDRSIPSFESQQDGFTRLLAGASKSGSNSLVIGAKRSATGLPIMANDPHLGIFAPNFWLIVGYRSPSYEVVGLTIPGLPFIAVGRNRHLAWGGTNMRAISSHLFQLDDAKTGELSEREETIGTRFWFDRKVTVRDSKLGPVVSDLELFETDGTVAMNWTGHTPSDEVSSFLAANRADSWQSFVKAFEHYSVGAQNILFADVEGNIGQVLAYRQPILKDTSQTRELIKPDSNPPTGFRGPLQLPLAFNPEQGYIASANNMPVPSDPPMAFGYSNNNRMQRMDQLVASRDKISVADVKQWHLDVLSLSSQRIQRAVVEHMSRCSTFEENALQPRMLRLWQAFKGWDARYLRDAHGPVAFESLMFQAADGLLKTQWQSGEQREHILTGDYWKPLTEQALSRLSSAEVCRVVLSALPKALETFEKFSSWGEMHQLRFGPPVSQAPIIGSRFRLGDIPADGSSDTLLKSAHPFSGDYSNVTYGACARHISDLSDPNENYFVLLGGQDGWLNTPHLDDQVELWQRGEYIRVPMDSEAVARWAVKKTVLRAGAGARKN